MRVEDFLKLNEYWNKRRKLWKRKGKFRAIQRRAKQESYGKWWLKKQNF